MAEAEEASVEGRMEKEESLEDEMEKEKEEDENEIMECNAESSNSKEAKLENGDETEKQSKVNVEKLKKKNIGIDVLSDESHSSTGKDSSEHNDMLSTPMAKTNTNTVDSTIRTSMFKTRRQGKNYRPRRVESSSSEDEEDNVLCDNNPSTSSAEKCDMQQKNRKVGYRGRGNNTTITTGPVDADCMMEDKEDKDTETETDQDEEKSLVMETESDASATADADSSVWNFSSIKDQTSSDTSVPRRQGFRQHLDALDALLSDSDDEPVLSSNSTGVNCNSEENEVDKDDPDDAVGKEVKRVLDHQLPKHTWHCVDQVVKRQMGMSCKYQGAELFSQHCYDSLHVPRRLERMYKMKFHRGCVNALSFNTTGSLLASGSDDLQIAVWDWALAKPVISYDSGHRNNVFQSKFLPLSGDSHIVSCARDGQVRLAELSSTGVCRTTRHLAKHSGPAHKLTTLPSSPHVFLSAGEDADVLNIDIRDQSTKVAHVENLEGSPVALYSIHAHPLDSNQFIVSGRDQYVRMYDRRIMGSFNPPMLKYCPDHLIDVDFKPNVTCAVYSNNGDAILASYNDDDIYLFDTSRSDGANAVHRYSGHRNNVTVKGVNFFGPSSRFIISGSDCGNLFIWDRETEAIIHCMPGDDNGVVNVLEPHPHIPVLATSGLDDDIKIWIPTCKTDPPLKDLHKTIRVNLKTRHTERQAEFSGLDTHVLMVLWNQIRHADRSRRRQPAPEGDSGDGGDSSSEDSGNDDSDDSDTLPDFFTAINRRT
ncbi:DDB1- and CUL4-associated factor 8-like [Oratosquilla oratoria]|uniref:DDB1- and CUL4-associated factor 8-like n=1 Tax=Oratosquilla oratoria TaxID=337810 RepID=UPI003F76C273